MIKLRGVDGYVDGLIIDSEIVVSVTVMLLIFASCRSIPGVKDKIGDANLAVGDIQYIN